MCGQALGLGASSWRVLVVQYFTLRCSAWPVQNLDLEHQSI